MENKMWLVFVGLAGLSWGVYVPLIAAGGKEIKNSYGAFLCVGVAYFLIAILFPLYVFWSKGKFPQFNVGGVTCATLAGVAGALGALCVIFATFEFHGNKLYVAPLIFLLAPIINTLVSLIWHPAPGSFFQFGLPESSPGWKLYVGIILAAIGAGLVLNSKEEGETKHATAHAKQAPLVSAADTAPMAKS